MAYLLLTWLLYPVLLLLQGRRRTQPQRILLIQTAKIGDMLCATPVLRALRQAFPAARITVMHAPVTAPIIEGLPEVDARLPVQSAGWKGLRGKLALARRVRSGRHDLAVVLSPSLPVLLALVWAGVPIRWSLLPTRVGRTFRWISPLLADSEPHRHGELVLDTTARLLGRHDIVLRYVKTMAESPQGELLCDALGLPASPRCVGLAISSANKLKELGEDKLVSLILGLRQRTASPIVLVGGPEDRPVADAIVARLPSVPGLVNSAGAFRLDELPALMRRCKLFIGVDSGLTYMADTFNVPLVSVVGPTDPREQRPMGPQVRFVIKRLPCYPCAFVFNAPYGCHTGTRACIDTVSAEDILREADALEVKW